MTNLGQLNTTTFFCNRCGMTTPDTLHPCPENVVADVRRHWPLIAILVLGVIVLGIGLWAVGK